MPESTVRDIARTAGVNASTVSRALRGDKSISPETRVRIDAVARELGYRPNPLVTALMARRRAARPVSESAKIGFINPFRDEKFWHSVPTYTKFYRGACRRAEELGYQIEYFHLRGAGLGGARVGQILRTRSIAGLLIGSCPGACGRVSLPWEHFAAVAQGYSLAWPRLSRVSNDYAATMALCLRNLRRLGYRRIGLAMWAAIDARGSHAWLGAHAAFEHALPKPHWIAPFLPEEWNKRAFDRWITKEKPDAIVTCHDEVALWLEAAGVKVGEEIGLAHTDWHGEKSPAWAGVDQRMDRVGAVAVDLLASLLLQNERGIPDAARTVLTPGEWVWGSTVSRQRHRPLPLALPKASVARNVSPAAIPG